MIGNVMYFRRPLFSATHSIVKKLCKSLNVQKSVSSNNKCIVLENHDMIVAIRKRIIDVVLLTDFDTEQKKKIYILAQNSI